MITIYNLFVNYMIAIQGRQKQIHIGGAEKGGAMEISGCISRGVRGYAPPEMFEI